VGLRRRRTRFAGTRALIVVAVVAAAGALWWWADPVTMPGHHTVAVYALDKDIFSAVAEKPGPLGRVRGGCGRESYYAQLNGRGYCLMLAGNAHDGGPLAHVRVSREHGRVKIEAGEVEVLRATVGRLTSLHTQTLVLVAHDRPVALVPVSALTNGEATVVDRFD
jgi:hypothetical protein